MSSIARGTGLIQGPAGQGVSWAQGGAANTCNQGVTRNRRAETHSSAILKHIKRIMSVCTMIIVFNSVECGVRLWLLTCHVMKL